MTKIIISLLTSTFLVTAFTIGDIKLPKPFKSDFKFIPSGLVKLDNDTLSVQSFYILDHEVTNSEYQAFLKDSKEGNTLTESKIIEGNCSSEFPNQMDNYSKYYYTHPAYAQYPVVNVTFSGALNYCEWLETKINTALNGKGKVKVRLPFHAELIRAAVGDNLSKNFAWKGNYLRDLEKGHIMCNFSMIPQEQMTKDSDGKLIIKKDHPMSMTEITGADILAPSKSYFPSEFGVYNLNGNAAEMTNENGISVGGSWHSYGYDVRIQSRMMYEGSSTKVGFRPVFTIVAK
jgi:formylglycine-generating enzyme required for sulfatase activity